MARTVQDYLGLLQGLLPRGAAWPREPEALLTRLMEAWAAVFQGADRRGDDLIRESDPRQSLELLGDWERTTGLPDPCLAIAETLQERRAVLVSRLTSTGGQSRPHFIGLAASLGYPDAEIGEYRPAVCGLARCGDSLDGLPEVRFVWRLRVPGPRSVHARCGESQAVDRLLQIDRAADLECLLHRLKPAHSTLVFAYDGV